MKIEDGDTSKLRTWFKGLFGHEPEDTPGAFALLTEAYELGHKRGGTDALMAVVTKPRAKRLTKGVRR